MAGMSLFSLLRPRILTFPARLFGSPVCCMTTSGSGEISLIKTAVHDQHLAAGGMMVDYAGFSMPLLYKGKVKEVEGASSIVESSKWTRSQASLFDVSHMCSIRWTGKDAANFLERVTIGDINGLSVNNSTLSVITNESGGAIDDTMITKCEDHIYQVINAGCAEKDLKHFDEQLGLFGGDVNMEVSWVNERGLYALQGPKAHSVLQDLVGNQLRVSEIGFGGCFSAKINGAPCFICRVGYTGEDGFEIYTGIDSAVTVWEALTASENVKLAGLGARDMLRMEAGLCLYGQDLTETITPPEAGLSWCVGASRRQPGAAPFLGSEIILAQLADRTLIKKLRCGLLPEGPPSRTDTPVFTVDGEGPIGQVTSGCRSPCLGRNISIAYINKPFNRKGTKVSTEVRGKRMLALTTPMPFIPTSYYKLP